MKKIIIVLLIFQFTLITAEAQWFTQQSGTTNALYDIKFINKNTGWCCGDGGYIIKTTNGGVNWIRQGFGVTFEPLFGIHPVDSNIVYAVGFYRTLIKTTNGGTSWFSRDSGTIGDGTYISVFFINENTGWIGNFGSPDYGVKKTTDGGLTLKLHSTGSAEDLYFKDSLNGIGVMGAALVLKTTNGGVNWSYRQLAGSGDFYRVSFINDNTGYTASTRAVYKTTNFGIIWDSVGRVTPLDIDVTSIEFCNENTGWAGTQYKMYKTINGGANWFIQNTTLDGVVYSLWAFNDSLVWGCGNGGRIWHTLRGGDTITGINYISSIVPEDFILNQNFPNPFNNQTKISFEIKKRDNYKLEIFNILGEKIEEVFNNNLNPGKYETLYNADNLSSGIYIYKLTTEANSLSKKFILIK